ncbi:hypothetical protein ACKFKH_05280 [Phormidesmis sp. 146-20]
MSDFGEVMMRYQTVAGFVATSVLLSATALRSEPSPTISRLVLRDRIVVITSVQKGLLYSVKTDRGEVLDANLSEAQLEAKHPELYQKLRPAVARPLGSIKRESINKREILWMGVPAIKELK